MGEIPRTWHIVIYSPWRVGKNSRTFWRSLDDGYVETRPSPKKDLTIEREHVWFVKRVAHVPQLASKLFLESTAAIPGHMLIHHPFQDPPTIFGAFIAFLGF